MIKTKSWEAILDFYNNLKIEHGWNNQLMIDFVEKIQSSDFCCNIQAFTSHDVLCVIQKIPLAKNYPLLKITYNPLTKEFILAYQSGLNRKNHYQKILSHKNIYFEFENLLQSLKWIP